MSTKHWLASYGSIPKEINPDAYRSVVDLMDQAMKRFAANPHDDAAFWQPAPLLAKLAAEGKSFG